MHGVACVFHAWNGMIHKLRGHGFLRLKARKTSSIYFLFQISSLPKHKKHTYSNIMDD